MDFFEKSREITFEPPNLTSPTQANPGTVTKIHVMAERYRLGQPLHHVSDETFFSIQGWKRRGLAES